MTRSPDRLALLETFARIVDAGGIGAAARDLGLSQPTASRRLAELEARLGATLVRRTTHELVPTEAGWAALADARALLAGWEAMAERHADDAQRLRGPLRVVAPVALGQTLLGDIARRFQADHPDVALGWELEDRAIRFAANGCDLWIRVGEVPDETLVVRELATVERLLTCAPGYLEAAGAPGTPEALEGLALLALEPFEGRAVPLERADGRRVTVRPTVRMSTNNVVALRDAALAGLGLAVLPRWFVARALAGGDLVEALPGWRAPRLAVSVAHASGDLRPRRVRAFVDRLVSELPASLDGVRA